MFNSTIPVPSFWPHYLMTVFTDDGPIKRGFHNFQLPRIGSQTLPDWSVLVHSLICCIIAAYKNLLELVSHNARVVFLLALVFNFSLLVVVRQLWLWLRVEIRDSRNGATEIKQLVEEVQKERQLTGKLRDDAETQTRKLVQLQATLTQAQSSLIKQRKVHGQQLAQITSLQNDLKKQKVIGQDLLVAATKRNESIRRLQAELLSSRTIATTQAELAKTYGQEAAGLAIDNELLKAIDGRVPNMSDSDRETFSAFAAPFVLVVIDGDAYSWSTSHFDQPGLSAGRHAAHAIKIEVQHYLLQNKDRIPLHSKIMTRVFTNLGDSTHMRSASVSFPRQFSESMPLFDFVNCGSGKERADSKIQELVHLFVANEQCHTIFFAAVTDNGFARLLEQYECVPAAKAKIVLVDPGYVAYEIEDLQYKSVKWPAVFRHRTMEPASRAKGQMIKRKRKHDSAVLNAVAARELVTRLTSAVNLTSTPATSVGINQTPFRKLKP